MEGKPGISQYPEYDAKYNSGNSTAPQSNFQNQPQMNPQNFPQGHQYQAQYYQPPQNPQYYQQDPNQQYYQPPPPPPPIGQMVNPDYAKMVGGNPQYQAGYQQISVYYQD